jgi:hypothetical protein
MIAFKKYWLLVESRSDIYCWIAPDGRVYSNDKFSHVEAARNLIPKFNLNTGGLEIIDNEYTIMYKNDWLRVTYDGSEMVCSNYFRTPNPSQKKSLIDMAEQYNMNIVVFDGGRANTKVIWSNFR